MIYLLNTVTLDCVLYRWADRSRRPKILIVLGILFEVVGNIMYFMGISVWFLLAARLVAGNLVVDTGIVYNSLVLKLQNCLKLKLKRFDSCLHLGEVCLILWH